MPLTATLSPLVKEPSDCSTAYFVPDEMENLRNSSGHAMNHPFTDSDSSLLCDAPQGPSSVQAFADRPPPESSTQNTPLAPSVEKAYYRKCIQLKRRMNEVESANDEAKIRRVRLERAIMKLRLERAFLLDNLRRRMEHNVDNSDASDDGMATPPPERPHRDKRRRHQTSQPDDPNQSATATSNQQLTYNSHTTPPGQRTASQAEAAAPPDTSDVAMDVEEQHNYIRSERHHQQQDDTPDQRDSLYHAPVGIPGAADRHMNGSNADESHVRDQDLYAGHASGTTKAANGESKAMLSGDKGNVEGEPNDSEIRGSAMAVDQ